MRLTTKEIEKQQNRIASLEIYLIDLEDTINELEEVTAKINNVGHEQVLTLIHKNEFLVRNNEWYKFIVQIMEEKESDKALRCIIYHCQCLKRKFRLTQREINGIRNYINQS
jgi:hypothetical protein